MSHAGPPDEIEYEALANLLRALAYAPRLELLDILRFPHTLAQIKLTPGRSAANESPDRPAAKPSVLAHINQLVETGLVRVESTEWRGRDVPQYVANVTRLYALVEEVRRLSTYHAGRGPIADDTGTLQRGASPRSATGPRMMLVHGVYEGKSFPLDGPGERDGGWVIGRQRGLRVSLDYDPFVSLEHAVVTRRGDGFALTDLGSKNGTTLNWVQMPKAGTRGLEAGDIISLGRSILVFRPT